jgi:CRP/FNR family transcriptional regulator, cyclic AMP receptor protein
MLAFWRETGTVDGMGAVAATEPVVRAAPLLALDPDLADGLSRQEHLEARARAIVPMLELRPGRWHPDGLKEPISGAFAVLVVEGVLLRELLLADTTATELLTPCDLADHRAYDDTLLPVDVRWSVPHAARIAILDDRILGILASWPSIGRRLVARSGRQSARLAVHRAIAQLPRVEQRLLALFGHLAERCGRVGPAGIIVPLQLTHETLGRLIGARRPTVSLALKELAGDALLERRSDGSWLLRYGAVDELGGDPAVAAAWVPAEARPVDVEQPERVAALADRRVSSNEVAVLHARVARLTEDHDRRMRRCVDMIDRCRATQAASREVRRRHAGLPPAA